MATIDPGNGFRAALESPAFLATLVREAVPVAGVLAFGWPALAAAIFFLAESWLFLSLRAASEIALNPKYAGADMPKDVRGAIAAVFKHLAYCLPFFALFLGLFIAFVLRIGFTDAQFAEFFGGGWREPSVLAGGGVLLATLVVDAVRYAVRCTTATPAERERDDERTKVMFYRVPALVPAAFLLGPAAKFGYGAQALVVAIAVVSVLMEAFPRAIVGWIEGGVRVDGQRGGPSDRGRL
ncbi:MAG TPA: hypothetical protein VFL14_16425 [Xanthomonadales bacterium]|nr:hypothetical protein [Xanthomonadales bacterium]